MRQPVIASSCSYARLTPDALKLQLVENFAVDPQADCRFFVAGLHDNYLFKDATGKYIVRVYRNAWRNETEIYYELELLDYLYQQTCPVAAPIRSRAGKLCFSVDCSDGQRFVAMFPYAAGRAPLNELKVGESEQLGQSLGRVHAVGDGFQTVHQRQTLDLAYLLADSVHAVTPFVCADDLLRLQNLVGMLAQRLPVIAQQAPLWGICVGDVNPSNCHIDGEGAITLFDFDQCGVGWRAFDIGKFFSSIIEHEQNPELESAFLRGYESVRTLLDEEHHALPYFKSIAFIWVMALHAYNADYIGHKWLQEKFWRKKMTRLGELCRELG